jgi:ComF family protein
MGSAMAELADVPVEAGAPTVVVAMPTTRARVRTRGYNQAELLARTFAKARGLPMCEALQRTRGKATQVALHPSERRANVQNVFILRPEASKRLLDSHVILVDDVLTTGATAGAAATVLARAGASRVTLVTFARSLPFLGLRGAKQR